MPVANTENHSLTKVASNGRKKIKDSRNKLYFCKQGKVCLSESMLVILFDR